MSCDGYSKTKTRVPFTLWGSTLRGAISGLLYGWKANHVAWRLSTKAVFLKPRFSKGKADINRFHITPKVPFYQVQELHQGWYCAVLTVLLLGISNYAQHQICRVFVCAKFPPSLNFHPGSIQSNLLPTVAALSGSKRGFVLILPLSCHLHRFRSVACGMHSCLAPFYPADSLMMSVW